MIVLLFVSSIFGISTIATGIGQYIGYFGLAQVFLIEIGIITGFCCINIIGISLAGKTETILTLIKIVPLILIALFLSRLSGWRTLLPRPHSPPPACLRQLLSCYWPFTGFEISAIPVEETADPRLIKKALTCVMVIVVSVYLLLNVALIGSVGTGISPHHQHPSQPQRRFLWLSTGPVVACIGIVAMLSAINAYISGTSGSSRTFRHGLVSPGSAIWVHGAHRYMHWSPGAALPQHSCSSQSL